MINLIENFFTAQECTDAAKEITEHKDKWIRCPDTDMFVLGNSYLRNQNDRYLNNNTYSFATVDLFCKKVSSLFQKEVRFCQYLARPGFQIIERDFSNRPCVWHYDKILIRYPYNVEFPDYDKFDTYFDRYYVLGLMISGSESSFDYFPETEAEFTSDRNAPETPLCENHHDLLGDDCGNPDCKLKEFQTVHYTQGSLLIQTKKILHRVGHADINGTKDQRMTLQAYAVVKGDVIYLFW